MSNNSEHIACPVVSIKHVEAHPDADRLDVATVGGWEVVVRKGQWAAGDTAVYIPEQSVLPDSLIEELGLTGKLVGKKANRVKATRLRGVVSQGLLLPIDAAHLDAAPSLNLGDDLSEHLGVIKWQPPIPTHMDGQLVQAPWSTGFGDIENWQNFPDRFDAGEPVHVTEKLHGTCCVLGFNLEHGPFVASKGVSGKLSFDIDHSDNQNNVYVRAWHQHAEIIEGVARESGKQIAVMGEIVGAKVQDLTYSMNGQQFFVFDIKHNGEWVAPAKTEQIAKELGISHVPVVAHLTGRDIATINSVGGASEGSIQFAGLFDHATILELAQQPSALNGGLREGVVVRPVEPRNDHTGRVISKYINPAYLLRHGGTERQ